MFDKIGKWMGNEEEDRVKINKPYLQVFHQCKHSLKKNECEITSEDKDAGIIKAEHGISVDSWGENITVEFEKLEENYTLVKLTSKSKVPVTLVDWGKNEQNVKSIMETLQEME